MSRCVSWMSALVAATLLACGRSKQPAEAGTGGSVGAAGSTGGDVGEPQAGAGNTDVLGDLLPLALRLDCSQAIEPPSSVYLRIEVPQLNEPALVARIDGDVCADADIAQNPEAPALALRCPPRQIQQFDTYPVGCTFHDVIVTLCAPGFAEKQTRLQDLSTCRQGDRPRPSCGSLSARNVASYDYERIVYALEPTPSAGETCPSFGAAPPAALANQDQFLCPCSQ